jgi:AcrR family transcriptional regulator
MSYENVSVRQKILLAAIECVEMEGIQDVTTRSIAKHAGVNSAAINYYFRTKENLLEEVLTTTAEHFLMDVQETLSKEGHDLQENLREFFTYLLEGGLRWPRITKAHLYETFTHDKYDSVFVQKLNRILVDLLNRLKERSAQKEEAKLRLDIVQMMSAVMFPVLMPDLFRDLIGASFRDEKLRKVYIKHLLEGPWLALMEEQRL